MKRFAPPCGRSATAAFVIRHFQEPGLIECCGSLDIPVIDLGESVMLYACALGRKIGLVTINPVERKESALPEEAALT